MSFFDQISRFFRVYALPNGEKRCAIGRDRPTFAGTAMAGTATTQLNVSATVLGSCIVSASPVAFGIYDPSQPGDTQAQGAITLQCSSGTVPVVQLSKGQHAASVSIANTTTDNGTTVANTASGVAVNHHRELLHALHCRAAVFVACSDPNLRKWG